MQIYDLRSAQSLTFVKGASVLRSGQQAACGRAACQRSNIRDGYDASQAKKMLEQFREQQALHIADRDRLIKELSELPPSL